MDLAAQSDAPAAAVGLARPTKATASHVKRVMLLSLLHVRIEQSCRRTASQWLWLSRVVVYAVNSVLSIRDLTCGKKERKKRVC